MTILFYARARARPRTREKARARASARARARARARANDSKFGCTVADIKLLLTVGEVLGASSVCGGQQSAADMEVETFGLMAQRKLFLGFSYCNV